MPSSSQMKHLDPFWAFFIAWLNLDLGIETCLYDGMDAYAKTWLQFLFPAYIWTIVIIIIMRQSLLHYCFKDEW